MRQTGLKILDDILSELQNKYKISKRDMDRLLDAIARYARFIQECGELIEYGEI